MGIGKDIRYDPRSMEVISKTSVQTLFASTVRDCLSESGMSKPMLGRGVLSSKSFPKRCTHVYLVPFADVYVSDGTPIASNSAASHDNQCPTIGATKLDLGASPLPTVSLVTLCGVAIQCCFFLGMAAVSAGAAVAVAVTVAVEELFV